MKDPGNSNNKIYISGLPPNVKDMDLVNHFGMLGQVKRYKPKGFRGFKDQ